MRGRPRRTDTLRKETNPRRKIKRVKYERNGNTQKDVKNERKKNEKLPGQKELKN